MGLFLKIVIPSALRKEMLAKIHTSHLGIVKCKQRAKDVLFWPGMGRDIEELVSKCDICSQHQPSNPKEPMLSEEIPTRPWESVSTDLFCLDGEDYLLIVDSYSHYIEIAKLSTTSSKAIVECTKSVFARHGIPTTVKSDNGPQFTAAEYKEFSKSMSQLAHIIHRRMALLKISLHHQTITEESDSRQKRPLPQLARIQKHSSE